MAVGKVIERNYGIDLLKIVSMLMVLILHLLGAGGILYGTTGIRNSVVWAFEVASFCAVNCYALISGYVMCESKVKIHNIINLWLQVACWNILFTAIFYGFNVINFSKESFLKSLLPVSCGQLWYFKAYFMLFFFIPALNIILDRIEKKKLRNILLIGFFLCSLLPTIWNRDIFIFNKGYSPIWLMYLYLIGAYIKKYNPFKELSSLKCFFIYLGAVVFTWLFKIICESLVIGNFSFAKYSLRFVEYVSPTIVISAVALFLCFARLKIKKYIYLIEFFAPLSFGVYVIHHFFMDYNKFNFEFIARARSLPIMVLQIILMAFWLFLGFSLLDWVRIKLFKILKIFDLTKKVGKKLDNFV